MDTLESMFDMVNVAELKDTLIGAGVAVGGMVVWNFVDEKLRGLNNGDNFYAKSVPEWAKPLLPVAGALGAMLAADRFAPQYSGYARGAAMGMSILGILGLVSYATKDSKSEAVASLKKYLPGLSGADFSVGRDPFARYLNAAPITVEENVSGAPITVEENVSGIDVAATFA